MKMKDLLFISLDICHAVSNAISFIFHMSVFICIKQRSYYFYNIMHCSNVKMELNTPKDISLSF